VKRRNAIGFVATEQSITFLVCCVSDVTYVLKYSLQYLNSRYHRPKVESKKEGT